MKKLTTIIALALLAVAGTGYAVTCAYDNVPGATLLVPYWKVGRGNSQGGQNLSVADGSTIDTLCAITNVSSTGIIVHATLWNKYSAAVLDWNIPMTGFDACSFSMRDVLNGDLNNNPTGGVDPAGTKIPLGLQRADYPGYPTTNIDACGANHAKPPTPSYVPVIGWGQTTFIRFSNPQATDAWAAIGYYAHPAFGGPGHSFRQKVWSSLMNSGDIITGFKVPDPLALDTYNEACAQSKQSGTQYSGDFSGYLTLDVNNYCSRFFPNTDVYWTNDAMATAGWAPTYTPNCIMGDVFYTDNGTVVSGDPMVSLEFDGRLEGGTTGILVQKTFYGKYWDAIAGGDVRLPSAYWSNFSFVGDGREPLGNHYGFRYYNNPTTPAYAAGGQTFLTVWRADKYYNNTTTGVPSETNLCAWLKRCKTAGGTTGACVDEGMAGVNHRLNGHTVTYDMDEQTYTPPWTGDGGPSGGGDSTTTQDNLYVFLETQRIQFFGAAAADLNPSGYGMGWVDINFIGYTDANGNQPWNQSFVGIQHMAGLGVINVGHSATLLSNQFNCVPLNTTAQGYTAIQGTGNVITVR